MDEYKSKLEELGIATKAPALDPSWTKLSTDEVEQPAADKIEVSEEDVPLEKRQASCAWTRSVITDKTETFVDWDVQMSPVVCSRTGDTDITVTSGYSVANTVGGSAGIDIKLIKDVLGTNFGINYSRSYTSSTLIAHKSTILQGNCGVIITRPTVTRRSGRQMEGCIGSLTQTGTWYADSHREQSYGGVTWVEGFIDDCQKRQPSGQPLSRCNGGGNFI
jgi:hypothetical protein